MHLRPRLRPAHGRLPTRERGGAKVEDLNGISTRFSIVRFTTRLASRGRSSVGLPEHRSASQRVLSDPSEAHGQTEIRPPRVEAIPPV